MTDGGSATHWHEWTYTMYCSCVSSDVKTNDNVGYVQKDPDDDTHYNIAATD